MTRALLIGILSVGALAACSTTPSHPAGHTASAVQPRGGSQADGSALQAGAPGRNFANPSYSGKQLRQTGRTDVGHALQMLDPSVTLHGQ